MRISLSLRLTVVLALAIAAAVLAVSVASESRAATLTVTSTLDDDSPGTLRQAIDDADPGDTIDFAPALDGATITFADLQPPLPVAKAVTIVGPPNGITIDADGKDRVLDVTASGIVNFSNVTFTNGHTSSGGGAIGMTGTGTLNLTNVTIKDSDTVQDGGGISVRSGTVNITDSTITGNYSQVYAGGAYISGGTLSLTNVTISGNTASGGGAIWATSSATPVLLSLASVTITDNTTFGGPGRVSAIAPQGLPRAALEMAGSAVTVFATNTIVAEQAGTRDCSGAASTQTSEGGNIDSDNSCTFFNQPTDQTVADPGLQPLNLNPPGLTQTHALDTDSPAVDAGVSLRCPDTDQRGVSRPQGDGCDSGAYELVQCAVDEGDDNWPPRYGEEDGEGSDEGDDEGGEDEGMEEDDCTDRFPTPVITTTPTLPPPPCTDCGGDNPTPFAQTDSADADCDGSIDGNDSLAVLRYASGAGAGCTGSGRSGDADCSGSVDAVDAMRILLVAAGLSSADC